MKLPIARSTIFLALTLSFSLRRDAFGHAGNGPEASHEAAKLNQRGVRNSDKVIRLDPLRIRC
ncbi:MAG TPA: hypothetical protein VNO32_62850 [Candidatus Acidoferrum sp.]|nr:hypothetical protein [Candidatus Acidoferrum sp.]